MWLAAAKESVRLMLQCSSAARRGLILLRLCAPLSTRTTQFLQSYRRIRYGVIWWPTGTLHFGLYMFKFKLRSKIVTNDWLLVRSLSSYHRIFLAAGIYVGYRHRRPHYHYHCGHHNHCCPHQSIFSSSSSCSPSTSSVHILRLTSQSLPKHVAAYI